MAEDNLSFNSGFAVGFIVSSAMCFMYMGILSVEKRPLAVRIETYKFKVPKLTEQGDHTASHILKYGVPDGGPKTRNYRNHVVGYDQARKIPTWVAEFITKDNLQGDADRDKCSFLSDKDRVDEMFSSTLDDYSKSGYDRGHMSPTANHKYSQEAMCDSFFLPNVVPQSSQHNRYYWRDVEAYCRDLTDLYEEVRVITGTLLLPETAEGLAQGRRFVKYEVIGNSDVAVPTHLYKVIVVENATEIANTTLFVASFLLPNEKIDSKTPLINFKFPPPILRRRWVGNADAASQRIYVKETHGILDNVPQWPFEFHAEQVPLSQLESAAGLHFLPRLADAPVGDLCSINPCKLRGELEGRGYSVLGWVLLTSVVALWVFVMFNWREQVQKAKKK